MVFILLARQVISDGCQGAQTCVVGFVINSRSFQRMASFLMRVSRTVTFGTGNRVNESATNKRIARAGGLSFVYSLRAIR
jgi:hypothetical protein